MTGLIKRIIKQMWNDKRSLALILVAPLLILALLYLLLGESSYVPVVGVSTDLPEKVRTALAEQDVQLENVESAAAALEDLSAERLDAFVTLDGGALRVTMLEPNSTTGAQISSALAAALASINPSGQIQFEYVYGSADQSVFNSLGYVLLGVLSFFFVFIISGISFVRERSSGTLERLMLTPVKRWEVIAGYTLGFGFFATLQSIFVVLFTRYALGMQYQGSVWLAILTMVLLAFTAVSMGALFSIFANNEFQVMQFIPLVIVPQVFFSGLIAIDTFPYGLGNLAFGMPIYYGCTALKAVMIQGSSLEGIAGSLSVLVGFNLILFGLNTLALRKYRTI